LRNGRFKSGLHRLPDVSQLCFGLRTAWVHKTGNTRLRTKLHYRTPPHSSTNPRLLAASAREILTTIGEKTGTRTALAGVAETTGTPLKRLVEIASGFAKFFKHANRDPTSVLENFTEQDTDLVLYVASHDFHRVAKGQPVELQVFEAWYFATAFEKVSAAPLRVQPIVRRCIKRFPGIRGVSRAEQQRIGLEQLEKVRHNGTSNGDSARSNFAERTALIPPIGFLGVTAPSDWGDWTAGFVQRLRELGWAEGRTVAIIYRWAEGRNP
jgi:hypothetical protein